MIEYYPWSDLERSISIELYQKNIFSIIDFELGGDCNANCIYCDSPDRKIRVNLDINRLEWLFKDKCFRWLFICGIGEPTAGENYKIFLNLLELCENYGIKCSAFTNSFNLTPEIIKYINNEILYIKFKFDSLEADKIRKLYGINNLEKLHQHLEVLKSVVKVNNKCTNIAASIVPTKMNIDEIPTLFEFCIENNFYPLIGHLEYSGRAIEKHDELSLSNDDHIKMYSLIRNSFGIDYNLPICPSVFTGVRIDSDGNIILDKETGLTCNWLWLKTPVSKMLKNVMSYSNSKEIFSDIIEYRKTKFDRVKTLLNQNDLPFGGCGGDASKVLKYYLSIHSQID